MFAIANFSRLIMVRLRSAPTRNPVTSDGVEDALSTCTSDQSRRSEAVIAPTPDARSPGLSFARQSGGAVIVINLNESGGGYIAAPSIKVMIHAVAPTIPAFLVVAARVRAEQDTTRF